MTVSDIEQTNRRFRIGCGVSFVRTKYLLIFIFLLQLEHKVRLGTCLLLLVESVYNVGGVMCDKQPISEALIKAAQPVW